MRKELTQDRLKIVLEYDAETGTFTWRIPRCGVLVGSVAGGIDELGYGRIRVDGNLYKAHRLAWMYVHGKWPDGQIDHINGIRDDNRIENLRVAKSNVEQMQNKALYSNNKSGYPGVYWHTQSQKWRGQIKHNGKTLYLGAFDSPAEAGRAYQQAKKKHHKFNPEVRDFDYSKAEKEHAR